MVICLTACTWQQRTNCYFGLDHRRGGGDDSSSEFKRWIDLAQRVGVLRLLVDGSFVTGKDDPEDIDAVILLPVDFQEQIERGIDSALELEEMILTRRPEEIFAAEDEADWNEWVDFFSRTREADGRRKGLVEVRL